MPHGHPRETETLLRHDPLRPTRHGGARPAGRAAVRHGEGTLLLLFQPIVRLDDGVVTTVEALGRLWDGRHLRGWPVPSGQSPDVELEVAAIRLALDIVPQLPPGVRLALNASPDTVVAGALDELFGRVEVGSLTLEITEQGPTAARHAIARCTAGWRQRGLHLAIDDLGRNTSTLSDVVRLQPEVIKLDSGLVHRLQDVEAEATVVAAVALAADTGAVVVAEGIDHADLATAVRRLGVSHGQGFALGTPTCLDRVAARLA